MICEFALEPELVATWHDRKEFLFFEEKFGLKTRRIVSAYPRKWVSQVWQAFRNSSHGQNQNAERNLDALLRDLTQNMIKRRNTFPEIPVWLNRVEAEHAERPFHAVLARENPRGCGYVVPAERLVAEGHPRWVVPDNPPVARNAVELVAAVAPMLRACRHIVFIDPYFDPTKQRFMEPMAGFLYEIWANRYGAENPRVELHTAIDRFFRDHERGQNRNPDEERRACSNLIHEMQRRLPGIIPAGKEVYFTVWKQREQGQKLHNRYILSEFCGVAFGTGLDQNDDQAAAETDDLHMMDAAKLAARWQEYLGSPSAFDTAAKPLVITGTLGG
ncbi:MAG: hypothetical protein KKC76_04360 [Proteobacteria bacterium]|nr:hypothetical protein [Pseudomonadota bacterium]MCG2749196.1 hypothetical protein [Desulfobulbaceae bacterium]